MEAVDKSWDVVEVVGSTIEQAGASLNIPDP